MDEQTRRVWVSSHGLQGAIAHGFKRGSTDVYLTDGNKLRGIREPLEVHVIGDWPHTSQGNDIFHMVEHLNSLGLVERTVWH